MTRVVMESAPVARPIASSAYSFVRLCGGAIAQPGGHLAVDFVEDLAGRRQELVRSLGEVEAKRTCVERVALALHQFG